MTTPGIIDFRTPVPAEDGAPAAANVIAGAPKTRLCNHYSSSDGQFFAGVWSSTVGKWRVSYSEHEFCHLISGVVVLAAADGRQWRFEAGDAFVVPAGFQGTWETVEPASKHYAILEGSAG